MLLGKLNELINVWLDSFNTYLHRRHKSIFSPSEAADIKSIMQSHGETTEQQKAVSAWLCDYAEHQQPFDEIKHHHTLNEVSDVAEGRYDWKIDRGREQEQALRKVQILPDPF